MIDQQEQSDYLKYRGKCKQYCEEMIKNDSDLILVRGHYDCPIWGLQPHWWCVNKDGKIIDPTKNQFPSKGIGDYIEFNGVCTCSECGKEFKEQDGEFESNYSFCSYTCRGRFVGIFD